MLLVLFGIIGSGKNYVGKILEEDFGFHLYDADQDLTVPMKNAIANHKLFTDQMRDEYLDIVIGRIAELITFNSNLAVAQAFFKNRNRKRILETFPAAKFIWVQSDPKQVNTRLAARSNHIAGKQYGALINQYFEIPTIPHTVLLNNKGRGEIIGQISKIIETSKLQ